MAAVRDFADELEGYAYLPRMFDKARVRLRGDGDAPQFGCPLDHTCMARLRIRPDTVLDLVGRYGDDDAAILAGLRQHGIPPAAEAWFDARATEDELLTGVYLRVRPRELLEELEPRAGDAVVVDEGEALFFLGDRQMRIVRAGEMVRVPPELPHRIEDVGDTPLRLDRVTTPDDGGDSVSPGPFVVSHPCEECGGQGCAACRETGVARFFHGTKAELGAGDLIEPGYRANFGKLDRRTTYVYFTGTLDAAIWGAELALGIGRGRIYVVEPVGAIEDDPNLTDKKFPGNPTKSYRSRDPLRVVGEVVRWPGHAPEQLKAMRDALEQLRQQGVEPID